MIGRLNLTVELCGTVRDCRKLVSEDLPISSFPRTPMALLDSQKLVSNRRTTQSSRPVNATESLILLRAPNRDQT
jgi:hypothetical protein